MGYENRNLLSMKSQMSHGQIVNKAILSMDG